MRRWIFLLVFFKTCILHEGQAQLILEQSFRTMHSTLQTEAIFPINPFEAIIVIDSLRQEMRVESKLTEKWIGRKLFNEHMLDVQKEDYRFIINPLANLRVGGENNKERVLWQNTRAVQAYAKLGKDFMFYTDFYENQTQAPIYFDRYITNKEVFPGVGIPKPFGEDRSAKDFAFANGYLSLQANKYINFQFGSGKHFWGHGYRSMFLSDFAFNYPYLRIMTKFWKIEYINLFTQMTDIRRRIPENQIFARKYATSHYLTIKPNDKFEFGLFETVIYQDTLGTRGYDINYLNPFILYRPVEFALGSRGGNMLLGGHLAIFPSRKLTIYSQLLLDELIVSRVFNGSGWWANKYSIQLGLKSFDTFVQNLFIQSEVNYSRPYTYTHLSDSQNYGHYNEPLAHPLGANFIESVSILRYRYKRWFAETQLLYAVQGRDLEDSNFGSDIYKPSGTREQDFGNTPLQGNRTRLLIS
ncbi:MAG: hypothetical protein AAF738_07320, partial [Bacteroidota bacterium]